MAKFAAVLCICVFALAGCAGIMPGPGQPMPGALVSATTMPADLGGDDALYAAQPDSFEVLGWVEGTASSVNVLGLISVGNSGYLSAVDDAKKRAGADLLISCSADVKSLSVLVFFASSKTIVRGVAVRRRR